VLVVVRALSPEQVTDAVLTAFGEMAKPRKLAEFGAVISI
jgi:hypothetical protein